MASILIVDSDRFSAELLAKLLDGSRRDEVVTAISRDEVRRAVRHRPVDFALIRYGPDLHDLVELLDGDDRPRIVVNGFDPGRHDRARLPDAVDGVVSSNRPLGHGR